MFPVRRFHGCNGSTNSATGFAITSCLTRSHRVSRARCQCRFEICLSSRVVQNLSERREERFTFTLLEVHEPDGPDLSFQWTPAGADFAKFVVYIEPRQELGAYRVPGGSSNRRGKSR